MRRLLLVLAGLVVLVFVAAVAAVESLRAGTGKDRIAQALSEAIGQPVAIGSMSVTVFPIPTLAASEVRIGGTGAEAAPGIAVTSLRIVPALLSLLPGRTPTIRSAELIGLVISLERTASGQWLAPVPASPTKPAASAIATTAPAAGQPPSNRVRAAAGSTVGKGSAARSGGSSASATPTVAVDALRLRDGAVRIVDEHLRAAAGGPTVTTITGINAGLQFLDGTLSVPNLEGRVGQTVVKGSAEAGGSGITLHLASTSLYTQDLPAMLALAGMAPIAGLSIAGHAPVDITTHVASDFVTLSVKGRATIDTLKLGRLTLDAVQLPFQLERNVFTSDPITFTAYSGHERGRVSADLSTVPATFALRTALDQLDVNQTLSATTTMKNTLYGTGHVSADVTGRGMTQVEIERSLAGTVAFNLADGDIRNLPVLATIDRVLGSASGTPADTKFQSFSGTATIANAQAKTTDLALRAGDLSLLGNGTLGFDQSLDFTLQAQLSAAKSAQITRSVALAKNLENSSGELQLPVKITGTVSSPKIGGIDLQSLTKTQLPGLLNRIFKR